MFGLFIGFHPRRCSVTDSSTDTSHTVLSDITRRRFIDGITAWSDFIWPFQRTYQRLSLFLLVYFTGSLETNNLNIGGLWKSLIKEKKVRIPWVRNYQGSNSRTPKHEPIKLVNMSIRSPNRSFNSISCFNFWKSYFLIIQIVQLIINPNVTLFFTINQHNTNKLCHQMSRMS